MHVPRTFRALRSTDLLCPRGALAKVFNLAPQAKGNPSAGAAQNCTLNPLHSRDQASAMFLHPSLPPAHILHPLMLLYQQSLPLAQAAERGLLLHWCTKSPTEGSRDQPSQGISLVTCRASGCVLHGALPNPAANAHG